LVNVKISILTLFLIAILTQTPSGVNAQNTAITNLTYPNGDVSSGTATVTFDLTYSGMTSSEGLVAAILIPATNDVANGIAASNPDQCISLAGTQYSASAACIWKPNSSAGTEHLTFNVQFPGTHIQTYNFAAAAAVVTTGGNSIGYSEKTFSIMGGTTYQLTVDTAYPVAVTVDGSTQASSPIELTPGTHIVSVPTLVRLDNFSRLRFDHWDDGSTLQDRTLNIQSDTSIAATFVRQYLLTLDSSPANATGTGWYDEGSTAQFSVPSAVPMPGLSGTLGARFVFKGWYENGNRFTTSPTGSVGMLSAHIFNAQWTADYTIPIIIAAAIAVVLAASGILVVRKRRSRRKTTVRKRKRKRKTRRRRK
jgi:hypothetical protein